MRYRRRNSRTRASRHGVKTSLRVESLEARRLLAGLVDVNSQTAPNSESALFNTFTHPPIVGPLGSQVDDWIVQLADEVTQTSRSAESPPISLRGMGVDFQWIRGLGAAGLYQLRSFAVNATAAELALRQAPSVVAFAPNQTIEGARFPNDSEFGNQVGLHNVGQFGSLVDADIDAVDAWEVTTGSRSVVVGVIDSGIDLVHPDLYLNVWLNNGEIPQAKRHQLIDVDQDALITFFDLNAAENGALVKDLNANGYIDATDLLEDPLWADGSDTDNNHFIDDFFGWNFRLDSNEPFAPNHPSDVLGHGTHVSGIIGATGNNQIGVAGVNWKTSLMSLKFLDETNRGDLASAIAAINYANMMRTDYDVNVRVLNNSWGQSGSPNAMLQNAIEASRGAGILIVAAAGNGNVLGQGINLDESPFYPASYDVDNVIAVGASDAQDRLASFSNFGAASVDLVAPGVGIRSTLPNGRYGDVNGTSMATPFVSGAAALIWTLQPQASVGEVREAILQAVDTHPSLSGVFATAGRLNVAKALQSNRFAPVAQLSSAPNIVTASTAPQEIKVTYENRSGIDQTSLGDNDLLIHHRWGNRELISAKLKPNSIEANADGTIVSAQYLIDPPGGAWDPLDFGEYEVETIAGSVLSLNPPLPIRKELIGRFEVRIQDPFVHYVTQTGEANQTGSLRSAIALSNADPGREHLIILEAATYAMELAPLADPDFKFEPTATAPDCGPLANHQNWSNAATGDFDVFGNLTIAGDQAQTTSIDAQGLDRVFKVHAGASLTLQRLEVKGGNAAEGQGGGGVLSIGEIELNEVTLSGNASHGGRGGGIAGWGGSVNIHDSRITANQSELGGGVFVCGTTALHVEQSTVDNNAGGGVLSYSQVDGHIENSTFTLNSGPAIASRRQDHVGWDGSSFAPSISADGQRIAFLSTSTRLIADDQNNVVDVFVHDLSTHTNVRASKSTEGVPANRASLEPRLSGDGQSVIYLTTANNLIPGDDFFSQDVIQHHLTNNTTSLISVSNGTVRDARGIPSVSEDGRLIVYQQAVDNDANNQWGVFIADSTTGSVTQVNLQIAGNSIDIGFLNATALSGDGRYVAVGSEISGVADGIQHDLYLFDRQLNQWSQPALRRSGFVANGSIYDFDIDQTGRFLTFVSDDSNLVEGDTNGVADVFVYDALTQIVSRVSLTATGLQSNGGSAQPSISADGRYIAFQSFASNLVDNDTNAVADVFVLDRTSGNLQRISVSTSGEQANGDSGTPSLSSDGRFVAFDSAATNLAPGHVNHRSVVTSNHRDVFVYDRQANLLRNITSPELASTVVVNHVTLAYNDAESTVEGNVKVGNSLFAGNRVTSDLGRRSASQGHNVLASATQQTEIQTSDLIDSSAATKLSPFQSIEDRPPGYLLRQGSSAIDAADGTSSIPRDQWGRLRGTPDVGALEAVSASIGGTVFVDYDGDRFQGIDEGGFPEVTLFVDSNHDGILQSNERSTLTAKGSTLQNAGRFELEDLSPEPQVIRVIPPEHWQATGLPITRVAVGSLQGNGDSTTAAISEDGSYIVFASNASNLVPADGSDVNLFLFSKAEQTLDKVPLAGTNPKALGFAGSSAEKVLVRDDSGVYFYDRITKLLEPLSVSNSGALANAHSDDASVSADGRWVVYSSFATNLVAGDTDAFADIYLYDRDHASVVSVTKQANGIQGNQDSENPSISSDGRFITFSSDASNLVPNDTNGRGDVFVYDRIENTIKRINVSPTNEASNGFTYPPVLSGDGRFIVFQSLGTNLTAETNRGGNHLFVADRQSGNITRLAIPWPDDLPNVNFNPSVSGDGQFIVFEGPLRLVDANAPVNQRGLFVYDQFTDATASNELANRLQLLSVATDGEASVGNARRAKISQDGRQIVFDSIASDLVLSDSNQRSDVFFAANPFESASRVVSLTVGEEFTTLAIGLKPDPGSIRGAVYHDVSNNDLFDLGEPVLANWTVYLDENNNQRLDADERSTVTSDDGSYAFTDVIAFRDYRVRAIAPAGWQPNTPATSGNSGALFLPAGGSIHQVNFGFQRQSTGGQSTNGRILGTVFNDTNGDGVQQANENGKSGVVVFLDLDGDEQRDFDEPRAVTDAQGKYEFSSLGAATLLCAHC